MYIDIYIYIYVYSHTRHLIRSVYTGSMCSAKMISLVDVYKACMVRRLGSTLCASI